MDKDEPREPKTISPDELLILMQQMGVTIASASADAAMKAHEALNPRENRRSPEVSAFNPDGERANPRPKLKCEMFWHGHRENADQLRPDEIEMFNKVPFETRRYGQFKVRADGDEVAGYRLHFDLGIRTLDERNALPSMRAILRQIVDGIPAS